MPSKRSDENQALPSKAFGFLAIFAIPTLILVSTLESMEAAPTQGERVILDFETATLDPQRVIYVSGVPGWGVSDCAASEGSRAAWSLGVDAESSGRACDDPLPQRVETSMVVLLDLEEFDGQISQLDLVFDLRMVADRPTGGVPTSSFMVNVLEQTGASTPSRITVYQRQDSTQGRFEEQRLDLTRLQDVYDPNRDPINLAGTSAFIELLYLADPVTGPAPAGDFVDHVRLAFGDAPAPSETTTPATASPPPPSPAPPVLLLPWLER